MIDPIRNSPDDDLIREIGVAGADFAAAIRRNALAIGEALSYPSSVLGEVPPVILPTRWRRSVARLARVQPLWFVQRHVSAWWYWRDLRIGLLIGTDNVKVSMLFLTVEFH